MQDVGCWLTMPLWNGDESAPRPAVIRAADGFVVVEESSSIAESDQASKLSRAELAKALREAGHCAAPVLSAAEMVASDQTRSRGLVFYARDAMGEEWPLLASPLQLKGTPPLVRRLMGPLGSDEPAILAELKDWKPAIEADAQPVGDLQ